MVRDKHLSAEDLMWVREFLDRRGGIQEALEKSRWYLQNATKYLDIFSGSAEKEALMKLADRILHRTY